MIYPIREGLAPNIKLSEDWAQELWKELTDLYYEVAQDEWAEQRGYTNKAPLPYAWAVMDERYGTILIRSLELWIEQDKTRTI